ncbi:MAG: hypothetical protein Q8P18_33295 [Pseudomonadota bacterium]|nr:hypothetical protein [Pseudomonadota bacterium]
MIDDDDPPYLFRCHLLPGLAFPGVPYVAPSAVEPVPVPPSQSAPLSSWRAVAEALGVDDSTVRLHRRRTRDSHPRLFADAAEARRWYTALVRAPTYADPPSGRKPRKKKSPPGSGSGVVDWAKLKIR